MNQVEKSSVTGDQFKKYLADSNLLAPDELASLVAASTADGLAQQLVELGKLTPYQAVAVLERRFHELHVGNYDILDLLGRGGMGTVYKARHRRMKRIVAIKVLARAVAQDPDFVRRFQREVETIAQLSHPNIVMAYDAAEDDIGHYLVMEFVNGRDLASEVAKQGPLSVAAAVDVTLQAARGLEYAHARKIIHRDIKPANLLCDVNGLVKVADLGLARLAGASGTSGVNASLTQAGGVLGTVDFMPPEQALDSTTIDHRADIYSLGCTLYFLLTGRSLYTGTSLMALLLQHRDAPIPSLRTTCPDVPAELDAVFTRTVAKKPDDRYPTMTALLQALEALQPRVAGLTARPAPVATPAIGTASASDHTVAYGAAPMITQDTPPPTAALDTSTNPTSAVLRRVADLTVVLVEPSRTQAGIVRRYLQQIGVNKVHTTGAGREAIALAKEAPAQVLLSAMHLSDMTGLQLAHALRLDPACAAVGFILASSVADSDPTGDFVQNPQNVLMPKPFDLPQLAQALVRATGWTPAEILPQC